jgi:hypothetical protein
MVLALLGFMLLGLLIVAVTALYMLARLAAVREREDATHTRLSLRLTQIETAAESISQMAAALEAEAVSRTALDMEALRVGDRQQHE